MDETASGYEPREVLDAVLDVLMEVANDQEGHVDHRLRACGLMVDLVYKCRQVLDPEGETGDLGGYYRWLASRAGG
jgi:hypothetical protein